MEKTLRVKNIGVEYLWRNPLPNRRFKTFIIFETPYGNVFFQFQDILGYKDTTTPVLQAMMGRSFPKAPSTFADLFGWPQYNTEVMIQQDPAAAERFLKLMNDTDKIVLHEDYAGIGTCGVTLVQQFNSFKTSLAARLPPGDPLCSIKKTAILFCFFFVPTPICHGIQVTSHPFIKHRPEVSLSVFRLSLQLRLTWTVNVGRLCLQDHRHQDIKNMFELYKPLVWCTYHTGLCTVD